MNYEENIKKKIGKDSGLKVPEGDFLSPVYKQVMTNLPERKPFEMPHRSMWQRMRPYVYLAAMFAGLWCTMKIVTRLTTKPQEVISLDNPPALVAQAIETPEVVNELNLPQQASDISIVTEAAVTYDNIDEFEKDFDYQFSPEVKEIDIDALQKEFADDNLSDDFYYDLSDDYLYDYYAYI